MLVSPTPLQVCTDSDPDLRIYLTDPRALAVVASSALLQLLASLRRMAARPSRPLPDENKS